jgi:tetratricopeptide (TPR) repeat protein
MTRLAWAICIVMVSAAAAVADPKTEAKAHVKVADTAFKLGRFDEALAEYAKAYELFPAPPLLFNLAQCHKNLKHWERAVFFFEGYLRERPEASNRSVVEDLIRESKEELAKEQAADAKQHEDEVAEARRKADEAAAIERERARVAAEAEQRRRDEESRQRAAEAERARAEQQRIADERRRREQREHDKLYRKWWFLSAVGGVALAAGGTAYYFSGDTTTVLPSGSLGGLDRR